ncbi:MAG: RnfH family protein [Conchiformibius sp.]|nr:RnfH family protein [Conchiformibius sp.]
MADIAVEMVYGTADKQVLYRLNVPSGSRVRETVCAHADAVRADFAGADPEHAPLGIFGKAVADDAVLQDGDRIEIYRPLLADPKEARRRRVRQQTDTTL